MMGHDDGGIKIASVVRSHFGSSLKPSALAQAIRVGQSPKRWAIAKAIAKASHPRLGNGSTFFLSGQYLLREQTVT